MAESRRYVYVARLNTGDEGSVRRILEQVPEDALVDAGFLEFTTYVGSGFCVLEFAIPDEDFQVQFDRFVNDPRVREFTRQLIQHLIEGEQLARGFAPGNSRFHPGAEPAASGAVTSAELPLAAEAYRWTR